MIESVALLALALAALASFLASVSLSTRNDAMTRARLFLVVGTVLGIAYWVVLLAQWIGVFK